MLGGTRPSFSPSLRPHTNGCKTCSELEAVIRGENRPDSLPIVTIGNADRVLPDRHYAELVAERLLEKSIAIDDFRGAGRLYVP